MRSRLSLGGLMLASTIAVAMLGLGLVTGLLLASRLIWRSAQAVEQDTNEIVAVQEVDRELREHHRLENLWSVAREPGVAAALTTEEADLRRMLTQVSANADGAGDRRPAAALSRDVLRYLAESKAFERRGSSVAQRLRAPFLGRALESGEVLRRRKEDALRRSKLNAQRALRFQRAMTLTSTLLLFVGLGAIALSVRWLVLHPIFDLEAAMRRFRHGQFEVQAHPGRLSELRELADGFNDMTRTIARQRRDQLTFLAAVAHDLRNPLSALKMGVQTMEREPALIAPERFQRLDRQLDRLDRMVGDLLDATRIESGQLELKLRDFDVRDAARAMVDLYAPTDSTHAVTLHDPERPIVVHGDPLRIEQVISNLVNNAIKYSPAGGPVEVSVGEVDGAAEVSVSDRGIGIATVDLPDLFQPFRRSFSSAEAVPGVGLGLSIARRIVDAHGGRIEVESAPDVGSTFRVLLPLAAHARQ